MLRLKFDIGNSFGTNKEFLAALAALGLPWSLTHSLIDCYHSLLWIQSLPAFPTKPTNRNPATLMGVMKKHDLTNKNTTTKTNANTKTMTITFRDFLQRAIFETFDL